MELHVRVLPHQRFHVFKHQLRIQQVDCRQLRQGGKQRLRFRKARLSGAENRLRVVCKRNPRGAHRPRKGNVRIRVLRFYQRTIVRAAGGVQLAQICKIRQCF
ncbi:hypothetical protein SDC9_151623 [bioreactor metagenome]|uniref:Uncharacterized protein n=1 Tax=bioreactor metagenome TaxID=1076179 RepID=A0A645ESG6_9ZZZZ